MPKHPAKRAQSGARVLLVDDSPLTIEVVRALLEREGFEVLAADSPSSAAQAIEWGPQIVILDVMLPGISGNALCQQLKQDSDIAVILFSNLPAEELSRLAMESGADAYLSKQSGLLKLPERLADLCEARIARDLEATRVLLVDDSELALHYEKALLELAGFEVRCARNLLDIVQELSAFQPHIVLTDVDMPDIKGDELCTTLKRHMSTGMIPIVLFSALPEEELAELASRSGADAYLSKKNGYEQLAPRLRELSEDILW